MNRRRLLQSDGIPKGTISGKFSVSATKQVFFSKGNLQYQASTSTWRFAEHQYDYVGDATNGNVKVGETKSNNALISETYEGWIDLFGWGTSGKTISNYGTANQPWATSTTYTDYGPTGNYNLTGTYADGDWGVNAISNGGNTTNSGWYTLDKDEWTYLMYARRVKGNQGDGWSFTRGRVNGVLGLVIYPDDYTGAEYSGSNWADFENAGCVFLPAAGMRDGSSMYYFGQKGFYWSSSTVGDFGAFNMGFESNTQNSQDWDYRNLGYSVRLVRPVEGG